jgi:hypothetical protein
MLSVGNYRAWQVLFAQVYEFPCYQCLFAIS